jgi:hypothetical protein
VPGNGGSGAGPVPPGQGGTSSTIPGAGGTGDIFDPGGCTNGCAFPLEPLLDANVTAADITPFAADLAQDQAGSFCVVEPQLSNGATPGALFPRNWLRPRFRWASSTGETLWEVRLTNEDQPDALRAYTRDTQWILPQAVWEKMRALQKPTTVTIRGLGTGGAVSSVSGTFSIAPVDAGGSMVFWSTTSSYVTPTSSRLLGFAVGDDGVVPTLSAPEVQTDNIPGEDGAMPRGFYACGDPPRPTCADDPTNAACCDPTGFTFGQVECVGCHVSTPDGKAVIFTDNWPWNKVAASIEPGLAGTLPDTVTPYAANLMKQPWLGMQALSPAHFTDTDRILITSYGNRVNPATEPFANTQPTTHGLAWFDLAAEDIVPATTFPVLSDENPYGPDRNARQTDVGESFERAWGLLATDGETRNAVTPSWSNDGTQIAYVSTDIASTDGHPDWKADVADIKVVPYNNHTGGDALPLAGASDPAFLEYYPEFSADDAFIAFARAPNPTVANRCMPSQNDVGVVSPCANQTLEGLGANPDGPYYNRNGEIYIVPRAGGEPIRLVANDPVSCTGETARGSINSWPRWSPRAESPDGVTKYYFLIFSSARSYPGSFELQKARLTPEISNKSSQLYVAPIVVAPDGTVTTYPAIYLWNQNIIADGVGGATIQASSNLTPAWDDFSIPDVPPIIQVPR